MKTNDNSRRSARLLAENMVHGTLAPSARIVGGTILALLDDLEEALHELGQQTNRADAAEAVVVEDGDGDAS